MSENNVDTWSPENTLRVLIASDIHLGHLENDPVRGEDSFIAFEEVLTNAVQYDVDLILLGGDLFDHAKPSPSCMYKATKLLYKYCFGDKPVSVELLSDQLESFSRTVNYEDPNLNISYPILSIHGNHDDPVGQNSVSSLDILSVTGLVNYFGRWNDYTQVRISPVLMKKGTTKLALYGLSHLKDQRLSRLFAEKKVEIELPEDNNDWFNLLVLHQNRADRGHGNYIPERVLPKFLDLVVWGHEHDSQVYPMKRNKTESENHDFEVVQPGSTVATSLAAGEALPKHCALLQIHEKESILTPIQLKTVRPFIFKTIVLSEEDLGNEEVNENEKVQEFLKGKVKEAIEEANSVRSGDPNQPKLPLIRLSVFYEHEGQDFNRVRFGYNFNGMVANPNDILIMKRERKIRERKDRITEKEESVELTGAAAEAQDIESMLRAYYAALPPERQLTVLSVRAMTDAIRDFTLKHDDEIFRRVLDGHKRHCVDYLLESTAETQEEVNEYLRLCKEELEAADDEQLKNIINKAAGKKPAAASKTPKVLIEPLIKPCVVVLSSGDEAETSTSTPSRGKAKTPRGGRGRGRGARGRARAPSPEPAPVVERRTPRRAAAQKTDSWLQSLSNKQGLTVKRTTRQRRNSSGSNDSY